MYEYAYDQVGKCVSVSRHSEQNRGGSKTEHVSGYSASIASTRTDDARSCQSNVTVEYVTDTGGTDEGVSVASSVSSRRSRGRRRVKLSKGHQLLLLTPPDSKDYNDYEAGRKKKIQKGDKLKTSRERKYLLALRLQSILVSGYVYQCYCFITINISIF